MRYDDRMPAHYLLTLDDFPHTSKELIGERAVFFGQLVSHKIPVPDMVCVPSSTWIEIVQQSGFEQKISQFLTKNRGLTKSIIYKKVYEQLLTIPLSREFLHELHTAYNQYFTHSFVRVFSSDTQASLHHHESIFGEANFVESILSCWAEQVIVLLQKHNDTSIIAVLPNTSIIAQLQPPAIFSGVAYTRQLFYTHTRNIYIEARLGEYSQATKLCVDSYELSYNAYNILKRSLCEQKSQYQRVKERLKETIIPQAQRANQKLSDSKLSKIAKITHIIKKMSLDHSKIYWIETKNGIFITQREQYYPEQTKKKQNTKKTIARILIESIEPQKAKQEIVENVSGVGLLTSENILQSIGIHPLALLQTHKKRAFKEELKKAFSCYRTALKPGSPIRYRLLSAPSTVLRTLKDGKKYSEQEENPDLGFRGALFSLTHADFLTVELESIKECVMSSAEPVAVILPFVRTPTELILLHNYIQKVGLLSFKNFTVLLELDTAENILNLAQYNLTLLDGVVFNTSTLHASCQNLSRQHTHVNARYDLNTPLISNLLTTVSQTLAHLNRHSRRNIDLHMLLETFDSRVVTEGVKFGAASFTVKPTVAAQTKESIIEAEEQLISMSVE